MKITRRSLLQSFVVVLAARRARAAAVVSTLVGTGTAGFSDQQVNNPYGVIFGPDGGLYFCDLDNQRIRRLDLRTRRMTTIAGNGQKGYAGDGGPATAASLNMPHEIQFDARGHLYIAERDNHVIRKVDGGTGLISTFAGTNVAGFSGDGGPAARAQLRQPHSIVIDRQGQLLICDIGNQRIRKVDISTGTIDTYAGTGVAQPPADGAPVTGTPLNGPRTMVLDERGDLYLALREGNAIYPNRDRHAHTASRCGNRQAGTLGRRRSCARGRARWSERACLRARATCSLPIPRITSFGKSTFHLASSPRYWARANGEMVLKPIR